MKVSFSCSLLVYQCSLPTLFALNRCRFNCYQNLLAVTLLLFQLLLLFTLVVKTKEETREFPQPRVHNKPAHSSGDDFLSRFIRNANLVASGVAKNMLGVGNYVKESIDDILFPYRKRPK